MGGRILDDRSIVKEVLPSSKLNFATIGRVSTDQQYREGKSEELQHDKIKNAVESFGAEWHEEYYIGGSQHATAGWLRKDFDQIKKWVLARKINAVMIAEADRWSRDPVVSNEMLNFMKKQRIRYFELDRERDLHDVYEQLHMAIQAAVGAFQAGNQCKKSYEVKLNTALKKGEYRGGRVPYPYMRNSNKNGPDYIRDPKKYKQWRKIRSMYRENGGLNSYSTDKLADMFGLACSTICRVLFSSIYHTGKRAIKFANDKQVSIEDKTFESVDLKVETGGFEIIADKEEYDELIGIRGSRVSINRKAIKNRYLLSRMIRCGHCGQWMSGHVQQETGALGYLCYTDNKKGKKKKSLKRNGCGLKIPARPLEATFCREFEHTCYDPERLKAALGKEGERYKEIQETREILKNRIAGIDKEYKNLLTAIKHAESEAEIKDIVAERKQLTIERKKIVKEDNELDGETNNLTNITGIKQLMNPRLPAIQEEIKKLNGLAGYTFEEKRRLLSYAFPATNAEKRKYGLTVWKIKEGHYRFKAECILDDRLFGEFLKKDDGWESDGVYSGKSSFGLY